MLLAIVAAVSCVALCAWPHLVMRRVSDDDVLAAFPEHKEPRPADQPIFEAPRELSAEAVVGTVCTAVTRIASRLAPQPATPSELAYDGLVRRVRRSRLWAVPLALAVAADATLLGGGAALSLTGQAMAFTLAVLLDVTLVSVAVVMFAMSCRKVTPEQRASFESAWAGRLRERAARVRESRTVRRVASHTTPDAPILERGTEDAIMGARRHLLGTGSVTEQALADQLLDVLARTRELEASPHRDSHANVTAQVYAEQVDEAMRAYLQLSEPTEADAEQVRQVLSVVDQALDREAERLDGKARLNLDVTRHATEALYNKRYGNVSDGQGERDR